MKKDDFIKVLRQIYNGCSSGDPRKSELYFMGLDYINIIIEIYEDYAIRIILEDFKLNLRMRKNELALKCIDTIEELLKNRP